MNRIRGEGGRFFSVDIHGNKYKVDAHGNKELVEEGNIKKEKMESELSTQVLLKSEVSYKTNICNKLTKYSFLWRFSFPKS